MADPREPHTTCHSAVMFWLTTPQPAAEECAHVVGCARAREPRRIHPRVAVQRIVAIAKAVHRLKSGTHRHWSIPQPDGRVTRIEMHSYPRSAGRVLRYLGEMIEKESELVVEKHIVAVLALKVKRYGPDPSKPPATADAQVSA